MLDAAAPLSTQDGKQEDSGKRRDTGAGTPRRRTRLSEEDQLFYKNTFTPQEYEKNIIC